MPHCPVPRAAADTNSTNTSTHTNTSTKSTDTNTNTSTKKSTETKQRMAPLKKWAVEEQVELVRGRQQRRKELAS